MGRVLGTYFRLLEFVIISSHSLLFTQKIEDTSNIELEFENLLDEFSGLLDEHKPFIFGNQPCDLDTLIYGHLKAIIANKEVFHQLYSIVVKFPNLVNYIAIIDDMVSQH